MTEKKRELLNRLDEICGFIKDGFRSGVEAMGLLDPLTQNDEAFIAVFQQRWKQSENAFREQLMNLYAEHFSEEDLSAWIDRCSLPISKKLIEMSPVLDNKMQKVYMDAVNSTIRQTLQDLAGNASA